MKIKKIPLENCYIRIGEIVEYNKKKYTCQKNSINRYAYYGCCFYIKGMLCNRPIDTILGSCIGPSRGDNENVIFKEVTEWKYFLNIKK